MAKLNSADRAMQTMAAMPPPASHPAPESSGAIRAGNSSTRMKASRADRRLFNTARLLKTPEGGEQEGDGGRYPSLHPRLLVERKSHLAHKSRAAGHAPTVSETFGFPRNGNK